MVVEKVFERLSNFTRSPDSSRIIAVTGYQGSGKTTFAGRLADYAEQNCISAIRLSSDTYHKHTRDRKKEIFREVQGNGMDLVRAYELAYEHDLELMARHFNMIRERQSLSKEGLYQARTGEKDFKLEIDFSQRGETWTFVDGVYVLNSLVRHMLDAVIFMEASAEVRHTRVGARALQRINKIKIDPRIMEAGDIMNQRWLDPQRRPEDIVIDNNDYTSPRII